MTLTSTRVKGNINPYQGMDKTENTQPRGADGLEKELKPLQR